MSALQNLPTTRVESWKYTDLAPLTALAFVPAAANAPVNANVALPPPLIETPHRLVFVDGWFDASRSSVGTLPDGVTLRGGRAGTGPTALNRAATGDGLSLKLSAGATLPEPVLLTFLTSGQNGAAVLGSPHSQIILAANASATIVEQHEGQGVAATDISTLVMLDQGARLRHWRLQDEAFGAIHVGAVTAALGRDADYRQVTLTLGARLSRQETHVSLNGPGANVAVEGAYLIGGAQLADTTTVVVHAAPHGTSRQLLHGVAAGRSRGVFQGKAKVEPGAVKTDAYQMHRALLLSPEAEADAKPELEIYADDVKCSHGTTTGRLDAEQLFYLRARGIPLAAARRLLVEGFVAQALAGIENDALRAHLIDRAIARLPAA